MNLTRRHFFRNTAAASAFGATVAVPSMSAEPARSMREQVIWHMRELERLTKEAGARSAAVFVAGHGVSDGKPGRHRTILIDHRGSFDDRDLIFWEARS